MDCVRDWVYKHWHCGHFIAGYQRLLQQGFGGLLEKIREVYAGTDEPEKRDTLEAYEIAAPGLRGLYPSL